VLNSDSRPYESVQKLLELVKNKEEDVLYTEMTASVKHCYMTKNTDPVVTRMLNEITLYAAKKNLSEKEELSKGVVSRLDTTENSCGCSHFIHTFLPCAHILQLRLQKGLLYL
jgi:cyanate lyase